MAAHAGDGSTKEPVEKRWPLAEVVFSGPTRIAGIKTMLTTLEAGVMRLVDGAEWFPGPMWYDPVNRLIMVGEFTYPLERVHYFKRAKMAITKRPPPLNLDKYTVGLKP